MLVSDAITRAYREGAIRPIGSGTPNADETAEGLYRLNALWKGIRATALGEVIRDWQLPNKTRTAPHDANNINQFYPQNRSGFNQPGVGWNEGDDTGGAPNNNYRQHYPPINCRILCKVGDAASIAAQGVVTFSGLPTAAQTITIGSETYTFRAAATLPFEVTIGADATATGANLVTTITANSTLVTATNLTGVVTLTAIATGEAGNLITLATNATNTAVSGATFTGGYTPPANICYFPQFPYDGARMAIVDIGMTEDLTIVGNGRYIEGATEITFAIGSSPREWLYRADIADWVYIGTDLLTTDTLPLPAEFDDFFVCGTAIRLCALDQLDPQPATVQAFQLADRKIRQRYYQPGIMSYGGQNAVPAMQNYNNYWGWGTNFKSGV